jgi:hypothetical protein
MGLEHWLRRKPRSRVTVGFHRVGIVLAVPLLAAAAIAAVWQWQHPSGPLEMVLPVGSLGYGFGDDADAAAQRVMTDQRRVGFNVPDGMMVVGMPLGTVRHNGTEWTRFQLPDGREIGIASTDSKKIGDIGRDFLLAEAKMGRVFSDKDAINFEGVTVAFLDPWNQDPTVTPPWQHQQRDWTIALLSLCAGLAVYIIMRALGWIINGFVARPNDR